MSPELPLRWFLSWCWTLLCRWAEQLLLSEDEVNFVPRSSSGTVATVKVGQQ